MSTTRMVTAMMVLMVVVMPWIDRAICRKLGVSLDDGVSTNPNADRLRHLRRWMLYFIFGVYIAGVIYISFLSRDAAQDYLVHVNLFRDLGNDIKIDFGVLQLIKVLFTEGLEEALSHVTLAGFDNINQVYLNICMFIPMGYLLPYVFDWFRRNMRWKTVIVCFLASLLIENVQLISRRGFYDVDDLISNTLGGFLGMRLYVLFAYMLTHPRWRQELREREVWRRASNEKPLTPFLPAMHAVRVTVYSHDLSEALEFYGNKMGLRLIGESDNDGESGLLYELSKTQIEIREVSKRRKLQPQVITIACNNSEYLKKNLEKHQIPTSEYMADSYTGLRTFSFEAPDETTIVIIEE
ncbi:MAG: VanZ family protein [Erysipelotrichaceae bacterium]|nr:VanZ family protein [Erysipelotrichaceae bacterium]